jgi:hypothetical protein
MATSTTANPSQPTTITVQQVPAPIAPQDVPAGTVAINAVKGIADFTLPGASLLFEGDIKSGTLHVVSGVLLRALIGPIGWFAVAADAFSLSTTGKHIYQQFVNVNVNPTPTPIQPPPLPPANT